MIKPNKSQKWWQIWACLVTAILLHTQVWQVRAYGESQPFDSLSAVDGLNSKTYKQDTSPPSGTRYNVWDYLRGKEPPYQHGWNGLLRMNPLWWWVLSVVLLVFIISSLFRYYHGQTKKGKTQTAINIAHQRYARGEISEEELQRMIEILENKEPSVASK